MVVELWKILLCIERLNNFYGGIITLKKLIILSLIVTTLPLIIENVISVYVLRIEGDVMISSNFLFQCLFYIIMII